jgi:hypothetical protein
LTLVAGSGSETVRVPEISSKPYYRLAPMESIGIIDKILGLLLLLIGGSVSGWAEEGASKDRQAVQDSLLFHASFDQGPDADFATGSKVLYSGDRKAPDTDLPPDGSIVIAPKEGKFGGALHFTPASETYVFYEGKGNLGFREKDWSGSCSLWLRLNPDEDLTPGQYCDPLQFVAQAWGEGNMFIEFSKDHTPRHFRYALLPVTRLWNPETRGWEEIPEMERPMVPVHAPPFTRESWTHIVFAFGNANTGKKDGWGKLYLDGQPMGEFSGFESTFNWEIEKSALTLGLNYIGWIDDVAVFDRALEDDEVLTLYGLQQGVSELKK